MQKLVMFLLLVSAPSFELAGRKQWLYGSAFILGTAYLCTHRENSHFFITQSLILVITWLLCIILARILKQFHLKDIVVLDSQTYKKKEGIESMDLSDNIIQEEVRFLKKAYSKKFLSTIPLRN